MARDVFGEVEGAKSSKKADKDDKGKTLFEHLGAKGINIDKVKKMVISFCLYCAMGYIIGIIMNAFMGSEIYSIVFAGIFALLWLVKAGKNYLKVGQ